MDNTIIGWKSYVKWPAGTKLVPPATGVIFFEVDKTRNVVTFNTHKNKVQARWTCSDMENFGLNAERKVYPVCTWVEPIFKD